MNRLVLRSALYLLASFFTLAAGSLSAEPETFQLLSAFSAPHGQYGIYQQDSYVTVMVKDTTAKEKQVDIRLSNLKGDWIDVPAKLYRQTPKGYTLYKTGNLAELLPRPPQGNYLTGSGDLTFAVRYTADGQEYWDNNFRKNYMLKKDGGHIITTPLLQLGQSAREYQQEKDQTRFYGSILVKNLAFRKKVGVVYTTDGWQTSSEIRAYYQTVYTYNYTNIDSPNAYGVEYWYFNNYFPGKLPPTFQYKIRYEVDGKVYWDDNFGEGYTPVPR
jgi:hypothetical protein